MKFFNWVHKRFHHHPIPKDDFTHKVENPSATIDQEMVKANGNDKDTQALLKRAALVDPFDGWKDGILAIGTFGFDPLKAFNNPNEYLILESEDDDGQTFDFSPEDESSDIDDDDESSEDEEENPLMSSALGHSFKADQYYDGFVSEVSGEDKRKVGRTTLADLFLADAEQVEKMSEFGSAKVSGDRDLKYSSKKQHVVNAKKGLSFAKKLIPKVKEDTGPIKNIQRLMRRMLKRKIHPELLDLKSQKSDGQMAVGAIELVSDACAGKAASDSVSLLATQGVPSEV